LYSNRRRVPCVVHPLHDGGGGAAAAEHGNVVEEVHAAVRPGPVPDEELEVGAGIDAAREGPLCLDRKGPSRRTSASPHAPCT